MISMLVGVYRGLLFEYTNTSRTDESDGGKDGYIIDVNYVLDLLSEETHSTVVCEDCDISFPWAAMS